MNPMVKRIDLDWFSSREDAAQAERRAILAEHPRYNKAGINPSRLSVPSPYARRVAGVRLPEITLVCSDGHQFTTRAMGGTSVRCKTCGKSTWVPAGRPLTEAEAERLRGMADHSPAAHADTRPHTLSTHADLLRHTPRTQTGQGR